MKFFLAVTSLICLSGVSSVDAQVMRQENRDLDSAQTVHRSTLIELRDGIDRFTGRLGRFQRNLGGAGDQTVLAGATRLARQCAETERLMASGVEQLTLGDGATSAVRNAHRNLMDKITGFRRALRIECQEGLGPEGPGMRADSLKAWGPHRISVLTRAAQEYTGASQAYARAAGLPFLPGES